MTSPFWLGFIAGIVFCFGISGLCLWLYLHAAEQGDQEIKV